ncbi:MAG TPA: glycosyltransferase [Candidatus Acidoferrales bacterium]
MKLACFYPGSLYCAWSLSSGLVDTLERMGHELLAVPIAGTENSIRREGRAAAQLNRAAYPTIAQLRECDGILLSGPEHMQPELATLYPDWNEIDVPKVSWLHETVEREDYGRLPIESIKQLAHATFTPAFQDQKFGMEWLPFGVDTHVFKPDWNVRKEFDAAFIGLMYPKRTQFMQALRPYLGGIEILHCNIQVADLGGVRIRDSAMLYADNLRRIKVFVNLPTLCQHTVTKVYEVVACGTFLITPAIAECRNFDNLQAHFYLPNRPDQLAQSIRFCLEHEDERNEATRACCEQVHRLHRLDLRCETLVAALKGQLCAR